MPDGSGNQVHYRKGTKVLVIKAYDGSLFGSVDDRLVYALEVIPVHEEKSRSPDADYREPRAKKQYIPPMSHPWKRASYRKFVSSQEHHWQDREMAMA